MVYVIENLYYLLIFGFDLMYINKVKFDFEINILIFKDNDFEYGSVNINVYLL